MAQTQEPQAQPARLSLEAQVEQAIIGAVLVDNEIWGKFASILDAGDFREPAHGILWRMIGQHVAAGRPADEITLAALADAEPALKALGGRNYLVELRTGAPISGALDYARLLRDLAAKRAIVESLDRIRQRALDGGTAPEALAAAEAELVDLRARVAPDASSTLSARVESAAAFCAGLVPPDYVIEDLIQRGRLYSLTGKTGHGKTAVALRLAFHVALGWPLGERHVERGRVLYIAAENPDDLRCRATLMSDRMRADLDGVDVDFIPGAVDLLGNLEALASDLGQIGERALVILDTAPALFVAAGGAEENNNVEMLKFALAQRRLTELPGRPAVVSLCHPTKGCQDEAGLLPRGGGAYLNELDGNLTCWVADDRKSTRLHWCGKLRGPSFNPVTFGLESGTCEALRDTRGRPLYSVVAEPLPDVDAEQCEREAGERTHRVLICVAQNPSASVRELARLANLPFGGAVLRTLAKLCDEKLIRKELETYKLTASGRRLASSLMEGVSR